MNPKYIISVVKQYHIRQTKFLAKIRTRRRDGKFQDIPSRAMRDGSREHVVRCVPTVSSLVKQGQCPTIDKYKKVAFALFFVFTHPSTHPPLFMTLFVFRLKTRAW